MCAFKSMFMLVSCATVLCANVSFGQQVPMNFTTKLKWNNLDYNWPSESEKINAVRNHTYVKENCYVNSVRVWRKKMFLTSPRSDSRPGVPVTLSYVHAEGIDSPNLEPYPNWSMQRLNDCSALQSVKAIEIDTNNRLWIADSGTKLCRPKVLVIDLSNDRIVKSYDLNDRAAKMGTASLNAITLEDEFAYITDSDDDKPGIIVLSTITNESWKKIDDSTMRAEMDARRLLVDTTYLNETRHLTAITISPFSAKDRYVYYSAFSSYHVYALTTAVLKDKLASEVVTGKALTVGRVPSQIESMVMSNFGLLYLGSVTDGTVMHWDSNVGPLTIGLYPMERRQLLAWPSSLAFDDSNKLWCLSSKMQNFISNKTNAGEENFRVSYYETPETSSQYPIPAGQTSDPSQGNQGGQGNVVKGKNSASERSVATVGLMLWIFVSFALK